MLKGSKSGPNTTACGECGGVLYWDALDEVWRHQDGDHLECIDTGRNE